MASWRAQFGGGRLDIDQSQHRKRMALRRTVMFHPTQPLAQPRLVDSGDGAESPAGVAVHGRVAHCGLAAVAGGKEESALEIGDHPDPRTAHPGLDVLQGHVITFPGERAADPSFHHRGIAGNQTADIKFQMAGTGGFRHGPGGFTGYAATVSTGLIGGGQQGPDQPGRICGGLHLGMPCQLFLKPLDPQFLRPQFHHEPDQDHQ